MAEGQLRTREQGRLDYRTYINSDEWKERRTGALERSVNNGTPRCEFCGRPGDSHKNPRHRLDYRDQRYRVEYSNGLEVHHLHYRTLGNEHPEDLIVLCTNVLYYEDHDARCAIARRLHEDLPPIPENVGCHERCHRDQRFRAAVERIAARRH